MKWNQEPNAFDNSLCVCMCVCVCVCMCVCVCLSVTEACSALSLAHCISDTCFGVNCGPGGECVNQVCVCSTGYMGNACESRSSSIISWRSFSCCLCTKQCKNRSTEQCFTSNRTSFSWIRQTWSCSKWCFTLIAKVTGAAFDCQNIFK